MTGGRDPKSLAGRVCLVTGATSGHGRALARLLTERGAQVILLGRSPERCAEVQREIAEATGAKPDVLLCDLSSRAEIDRAAAEFLASGRPLHVLVSNAGLVNLRRTENAEGLELTFAVNYLAAFQLCARLAPRMVESAPARIVIVSSDTYRIASLDLDDLMLERRYSWMRAYARSKLALVHLTRALARRLEGTGVAVNAVDPGPIASNIGANNPGALYALASLMIRHTFPSPKRAARTALMLCTAPEVEGQSGAYWRSMKRREIGDDPRDTELDERLWQASAKLTGVDFRR
jgi:NAD(P)-dependent dehydrogenase (short-subunit alcohol dehydrogenase family)